MSEIPMSVPYSQVTVPAKTVGWSQQISAAVRRDDALMQMMSEEGRTRLAEHAASMPRDNAGWAVTSVDDVEFRVVESIFVVDVTVPAPRKWWHQLLFRHPTMVVTDWQHVPGDVAGADFYRVNWRQRVIECPPEMAGRVRHDVSRSGGVTFAAGPSRSAFYD